MLKVEKPKKYKIPKYTILIDTICFQGKNREVIKKLVKSAYNLGLENSETYHQAVLEEIIIQANDKALYAAQMDGEDLVVKYSDLVKLVKEIGVE